MGNYNPRPAAALGLEQRPSVQQYVVLEGPRGIAMRIMPRKSGDAALTLDGMHPFYKEVIGQPGAGHELLTTIGPPVAPVSPLADGKLGMGEHKVINVDTGAVMTGWQTQAGSSTVANLRGAVDEFPFSSADYVRNTSALTPSSKLVFAGRGNDAALTGKRIDAIEIVARHRTLAASATTRKGPDIQGYLNIGGSVYYGRTFNSSPDGKLRQHAIGIWRQNPATNKPWTLAEVNLLVASGATDEWGFEVGGASVAPLGFHVDGLVMVVFTTGTTGTGGVGEPRIGVNYQAEAPPVGWNTFALTAPGGGAPSALSVDTWYYSHQFALSGSGKLIVPMLIDPRADLATTTAASQTGLHREVYLTTISPSGVITAYERIPGAWIPLLFSAAGTMHSSSQAYAEINNVDEHTSSTAFLSQQITTPSGTQPARLSIAVPIGWGSPNQPTAPLNLQVRHGAGADTGGGTLLATIFVQPGETTQQVKDRVISLGPGITPPASTQLFIHFDSATAEDAPWRIGRLDTRSDATNGPTLANIEKQSYGSAAGDGQTDSQSYGATAFDRYDIAAALVAAPGEIGGTPAPTLPVLTATVRAAA